MALVERYVAVIRTLEVGRHTAVIADGQPILEQGCADALALVLAAAADKLQIVMRLTRVVLLEDAALSIQSRQGFEPPCFANQPDTKPQ